MKELKRSVLLWTFFLPCFLQSQSWFQEADVWHYELTGFAAFTGYERIQYDRDTVLEGQLAKVVSIETESVNNWDPNLEVKHWTKEQIVLEKGDSLMLYIHDKFVTIYDFGLNVGDSMQVPTMEVEDQLCENAPPITIHIVETGDTSISGRTLRFQRWRVVGSFFNYQAEGVVVEGIGPLGFDASNWDSDSPGHQGYIFYSFNGPLRCALDMPEFDFRCFSNEQITYQLGDVPCDFIVLDTEEQDDINQFQITPNPVDQYFSITLPEAEKLESITLFTLDGKAMKSLPVRDSQNLYIGDLRSGMYVIRLKLTDQRLAFGRVLKL